MGNLSSMLRLEDRIRQRQVWGVLTALVAESRSDEGAVFRVERTGDPTCIASTPGFCDTDQFVARMWQAERRLLLSGGAIRAGGRAILPLMDTPRASLVGLIYLEGVPEGEPSAPTVVFVDRLTQRVAAGGFRHPPEAGGAPEATPEARRAAAIREALARARGNVSRAAVLVGCHRTTLHAQMVALGIRRAEFRGA
jgi:hypothetical protein